MKVLVSKFTSVAEFSYVQFDLERDIVIKPLAEVNDVYKEPLTLELPPSDSVASIGSSISSGRLVSCNFRFFFFVRNVPAMECLTTPRCE